MEGPGGATRSRHHGRERVRVLALSCVLLVLVTVAPPADAPPAAAASATTAATAAGCERQAPLRHYRAVAVNVDITVNRFLDHDPEGRMYVLEEDLARVRAEEAANAAARAGRGEPSVTAGLQGDAIQPLTLRVRPGECLQISLRNGLGDGEPASLHVHGAPLQVVGGGPAIATDPRATAAPGEQVTYQWMVPRRQPEGTHSFHSHGDTRAQTSHGLFGAVVVEPPGSTWSDPRTGAPLRSGWDAIVRPARGSAFREFALYYHEVGHENFQLLDGRDDAVPLVDPVTGSYRPASRALNYRSEPFGNRLALQRQRAPVGNGTFDEAVAYSSYSFGDPATPILRTYLGDPVKQRVVHGGSELFHVHHVHGGATRWPRQPGVEPTRFDSGPDKHPPLRPEATERTDSQSLGPSETFDVVNECGAGGCQGSVGDFLYHCHVAEHYFAGMWGLWRTYNTTQDGVASTDTLPPLREVPGRGDVTAPAVTSAALAGATVTGPRGEFTIAPGELGRWVERQLPPAGVPRGYDAAVLDWRREGEVYTGEPETPEVWPGYRSPSPGQRPPLRFDRRTGKLAFPFLRPHLGKRPPFAPNHGPSPFLEPDHDGTDPPVPGANGPGSLCPEGTKAKTFDMRAVNVAVPVNERLGMVDPGGLLYVLKEDQKAVEADPRRRVPLAIRANAGEHCVDVILSSALEDTPESHGFSKVNAHIHFVQFDVQASDGVVSGFNYEQSVRPYRLEGTTLLAPAARGATTLSVADSRRFQPGIVVGVGMDAGQTFEAVRITAVNGQVVTLAEPLDAGHDAGEVVSTEFVRYRWYDDTQFGTAYFHDHVNAIGTWRHGLFGALVSEPPGSTYHDPHTGEEVRSGALVDVHTDGTVSDDVSGSFRELVSFLQDESTVNSVGRSTGSALNLRAEPLHRRGGHPALAFSSAEHGDPATPVVEAYVGDPVVVRSLVSAANEVHTWHVDGHWFRKEPNSSTSPPVSTAHIGISERFDLVLPAAGGPQRLPGDYLYGNGRSFKMREGSWGLLRVRPQSGRRQELRPLPGHETPEPRPPAVCPAGAAVRTFDVVSIDVPLPMLGGRPGRIFALAADAADVRSGRRPPEPLVLHIGVGDCVKLRLTNASTAGAVSLRCDLLAADPSDSGGVAAGFEPDQTVAPGRTRTSTYYASPEVGETVSLLRDGGDVVGNSALGLYGAIVVGPAGARYRDPVSGDDVSDRSTWSVVVEPPSGPAYRDFTLLFQDEDASIGSHRMPYTTRVQGTVGVNYHTEPLEPRLDADPDTATVFGGAGIVQPRRRGGPPAPGRRPDPSTPLLEAYAGDPVRIHAVAPWSEQSQVFSIEGHHWPLEPGRRGTTLVSSVPLGGLDVVTATLAGGAGGTEGLPGDYVWGDHREPYREAGLWGLFRVMPRGHEAASIRPLRGAAGGGSGPSTRFGPGPALAGGFFAALVVLAAAVRRRVASPGR